MTAPKCHCCGTVYSAADLRRLQYVGPQDLWNGTFGHLYNCPCGSTFTGRIVPAQSLAAEGRLPDRSPASGNSSAASLLDHLVFMGLGGRADSTGNTNQGDNHV